jgi:hypothetical protein
MQANKFLVKISKDFTTTPGARYYEDGPFSGQEFFEKKLNDSFQQAISSNQKLFVDLDGTDGTEGYATSFLDEAFRRLALQHGKDAVLKNLVIISHEEPDWIAEIKKYIGNA